MYNFEADFCAYTPTIDVPDPYNQIHDYNFESKPFELLKETNNEQQNVTTNAINVFTLMKEHHSGNRLPIRSSYACHWCCHTFDTLCIGLPMRYEKGVFFTIGNFCSVECACAYNFDYENRNYDVWDIYSMINMLAEQVQASTPVYPAPPRKCLQLFGGYMNIDEFRENRSTKKIICDNQQPMCAMVNQVEEINDFHHRIHNRDSIPLDINRLQLFENKLKLIQRVEIINNIENTLDHTMGVVTC